jgi:hypothetical protein
MPRQGCSVWWQSLGRSVSEGPTARPSPSGNWRVARRTPSRLTFPPRACRAPAEGAAVKVAAAAAVAAGVVAEAVVEVQAVGAADLPPVAEVGAVPPRLRAAVVVDSSEVRVAAVADNLEVKVAVAVPASTAAAVRALAAQMGDALAPASTVAEAATLVIVEAAGSAGTSAEGIGTITGSCRSPVRSAPVLRRTDASAALS